MPTATPSYYPRHASGGLREAGSSSLLNVAPYFQFCCTKAIHRVGVASRPCKAIQLKSAYTSSFRQLKSAIRRSCMIVCTAPMYGGSRSFCQKRKGKNS